MQLRVATLSGQPEEGNRCRCLEQNRPAIIRLKQLAIEDHAAVLGFDQDLVTSIDMDSGKLPLPEASEQGREQRPDEGERPPL